MATPVAIASIGNYYFIIFCIISFCIPVSVFFFYPETMGQSLEQIDVVFRDNKTPMSIVKASKLLSSGDLQKISKKRDEKQIDNIEEGKEIV